jgi:hypothetical protein
MLISGFNYSSLTVGIKHKKCQVGRNAFVDFVWAKIIVIEAEMALNRRGLRALVGNTYGSIAITAS